ncbi:MAG: hypothetical protein M1838_006251 [Thelocarpon superellum]|nr:MAG: hypothetical protein M1838_006251 [Thelocarpon superellum]
MVVQAMRNQASTLVTTLQSYVDSVAPPETRQQVSSNLVNFALEQPFMASFILAQTALSALPLLIFASFVLGTLLLSIVAALAFSIFWLGAAVLVLVPTLFIAFSLAAFIWLWAVGSFISLRFAYTTLYAALGTPEIKASVKTENGVTSVSTIPRTGDPKIERVAAS